MNRYKSKCEVSVHGTHCLLEFEDSMYDILRYIAEFDFPAFDRIWKKLKQSCKKCQKNVLNSSQRQRYPYCCETLVLKWKSYWLFVIWLYCIHKYYCMFRNWRSNWEVPWTKRIDLEWTLKKLKMKDHRCSTKWTCMSRYI